MSINDSTANTTPPQGFTPASGFEYDDDGNFEPNLYDGPIQAKGMLRLDSYWYPDGRGFAYSIDPGYEEYNLADLKVAYSELDAFIRRAEQVEGL